MPSSGSVNSHRFTVGVAKEVLDTPHIKPSIFAEVETAPGERGTIITVLQEFRMSKLASAWETLTGRNPKQAIVENLRHFKALAETGEIPRTQGHGRHRLLVFREDNDHGVCALSGRFHIHRLSVR
jgi:hypothetical protein